MATPAPRAATTCSSPARASLALPPRDRRQRLLGGLAAHLGLRLEPDARRRPRWQAEQRASHLRGEVRAAHAGGLALGQRLARRDRGRDAARAAALAAVHEYGSTTSSNRPMSNGSP